jgi:HAD superfamily hydrolase (TIGR01662 family)
MSGSFEVLLFDLGDTLVYDRDPWQPILARADIAMRRSLKQAGYPLAPDAYGKFSTIFELYYHRRVDSTKEETTVQLLQELMQAQGSSPPRQALLDAMGAMYAITQKNWYPEVDAQPTLQQLKEQGYRLGLISNAADDENVQALIDKADLRTCFHFILSSAACGIRKPDRYIFQLALDHFNVEPENAAMIGDTLEADIYGANLMGIYSIWINRRVQLFTEGELSFQPQAVISSLEQLPALLGELRGTKA